MSSASSRETLYLLLASLFRRAGLRTCALRCLPLARAYVPAKPWLSPADVLLTLLGVELKGPGRRQFCLGLLIVIL